MSSGSWGSKTLEKEAEETYQPKQFTQENIAEWIEETKKAPLVKSPVCTVLYGWDGTGKSGIPMDSRTEEDIADGKKIIIFDIDGSAGPLKKKYHKGDENIMLLDPLELMPDGNIDYVSSFNKTLALTKFVVENERDLNLHAVCLDGLDTFLKWCEMVMRYLDLKLDPDTQIKDSWNWMRRNRRYQTVVLLLKRLACERYYTTHFKEQQRYVSNQLQTIGRKPDWEKHTPGILFQRILLERSDQDKYGLTSDGFDPGKDDVVFTATIEKSKGALHLEGKRYVIATTGKNGTKWNGLADYLQELRKAEV